MHPRYDKSTVISREPQIRSVAQARRGFTPEDTARFAMGGNFFQTQGGRERVGETKRKT